MRIFGGRAFKTKKTARSKGPEAGMCLECLRPVWLQQREQREWWEERGG